MPKPYTHIVSVKKIDVATAKYALKTVSPALVSPQSTTITKGIMTVLKNTGKNPPSSIFVKCFLAYLPMRYVPIPPSRVALAPSVKS